ncbi:hypothetical protein LTR53_000018 [Teratosphaeriaceae sp. CCFEE 6253]|nr:hypothetical protein LTR53_000018 [Teratosphaeriaceae sp. CCFEE 6253]
MFLGIPFLLSLISQIYFLTRPLRAFCQLLHRLSEQQTSTCVDEALYRELVDDRGTGIADPDLRSCVADMSLVAVSALYTVYGILCTFTTLNMVTIASYATDRLALSQEMTASFAKMTFTTVNYASFKVAGAQIYALGVQYTTEDRWTSMVL